MQIKIRTRPQCSILWMHRNVLGSYVPTTMSCRYSSKRIKFLVLFCLFCVSNFFSELKSYPGVVFVSNFRITKLLNLHLRIRILTKTFQSWITDWVTLPLPLWWQCKGVCAGYGTGCRLPDRSFHDCPAPNHGSHWPGAAEARTGRHLSNLWSLSVSLGEHNDSFHCFFKSFPGFCLKRKFF